MGYKFCSQSSDTSLGGFCFDILSQSAALWSHISINLNIIE